MMSNVTEVDKNLLRLVLFGTFQRCGGNSLGIAFPDVPVSQFLPHVHDGMKEIFYFN